MLPNSEKSQRARAPVSLTALLASAFAVLSVVALLVASAFQITLNYRAQKEVVAARQQVAAQQAAKEVSGVVEQVLGTLEAAAQVGRPSGSTEAERQLVLQSLLRLQPTFREVTLLNSRGFELAKESRQTVFDPASYTNRENSELFQQVSRNVNYIGPLQIAGSNAQPEITVAVPFKGLVGEFEGALVAEVNMKFMWDTVAALRLGPSGQAFVVDRQGQLIAHQDSAGLTSPLAAADLTQVAEFIRSRPAPVASETGIVRRPDGTWKLETRVALEVPDWAVVVETPLAEAYRPLMRSVVLSAGGVLVVALLAIWVGLRLSRRLAAPLVSLTETAARIADGQLDLVAPVRGTVEVNRLARAFNTMTAKLRESIQSLEQRLTDLHAAQDALKAKSDELDRYFTNALDLLCIAGTDGRFRRLNKEWEAVLGYTIKELEGTQFFDYVHPDDLEATRTAVSRLAGQESILNFVNRYRGKDGGYRWIDWRSLPVGDVIYAAARDITQRKEAEAALLESEQRFRRLAEATFEGVGLARGEVWEDCNNQLAALLGTSRGELRGRALANSVAPEDLDRFLRLLAEDSVEPCEVRVRRPDGTVLPVEVRTRAATLTSQALRVIAVRDLTERKHAELLIRVRLQLMEFAVGHATEELLQKAVDEAGALTGSPVGFYHFVEQDEKALSLQAWSTRTKAEFCQAEGAGLHYPIDQAGVWTDCVRERGPVIHNDYAALPHRKGLPEGHAPLIRELVVPVFRDHRIVAILGLGNKPRDYTEQDVEWATFVADLAWEIAERKRTEGELQRTHSGLENIGIGVLEAGPDARIRSANAAACRLLGYTAEELGRLTVLDVNPTITPDRWAEQRSNVRAGETRSFETWHLRKDGSTFPSEVTVAYHEVHGRLHSLAFVRDITERKRAEQALRESMARLQTVVTGSPIVLYSFDRHGVFTLSEGKGLAGLGLKPGEIVGRTVFEVYGDQPEAIAALHRALAGETFTVELSFSAGSVFEASHIALHDDAGEYEGTIGVLVDITERKRAEAALRHSHDLMRYVIEHTRSAVAVHDRDLKYVYVSQRYLDDYNVQEKDIIGKHHYEVFPDLPQKWREVHQRALAGEVTSAEDDPYPRGDGSVEWTRWECRPWYQNDGTIGGIIVYTEVITARKRTELALRESEQRYALAQRAANIGSWDWNILTGEIRWSEQIAPLFGLAPGTATISYETFTQCVYLEDREPVARALQATLQAKADYDIEHRIIWPDGTVRWVSEKGEVVRDAGGKAVRMLGVVQDITGRKWAEAELQASENRYRQLFENNPQPMWVYDLETLAFLAVNAAAIRHYGYTREEFLAMTLKDIRPREDVPALLENIVRVTGGQDDAGTWRHRKKDGTIILVEITSHTLRFEERDCEIVLAIDVTERKRVEEALRESEQKFRAVVENAQAIIFMLDAQGVFRLSEGLGLARLGLAPGQVVGQSALEIYKDVPSITEGVQAALAGRTVRTTNWVGDWVFDSVYSPYFTPDGRQDGVVGIAIDITEKARAEALARESQERLGLALQGADLGSWDWNVQTGETRINERWAQMLGCRVEEIEPHMQSWESRVHPDDLPQVREALQAHLEGRTPFYEVEHRLRHKSGQWIWVLDRGKVIQRDAAGQPLRAAGTHLDITERKRAEEELFTSRQMLRTVLDTIPVRVFWKDRDSVYVGGNRALAQDCGYDNPEALVGKTDFDTVSVATAELYRADDRRVMETGEAKLNFEEPQRRRDGSVGWLRTNKVPLRDQQGRVIGVLGTYEDITERKRAEEALAQERELLATVINLLPDSVYVKDRDSRFLLANQVVATRLGKVRPTDVLGLTDGDFYPVATAAGYRADEEQVLAGAAIREKEEHVVYPQGQVLTVLTTKVPLRNRQGDVVGLVGVGRDITERKRAEETLAQERELLSTVINVLPDSIYAKDCYGRFLLANRALAERLGKTSPNELLGLTNRDVFSAEDAEAFKADEEQVLAGTPLRDREDSRVYPNGAVLTVLVSKVPLRNQQGVIVGLVGTGRDITARKRAEEALRQSEEKFRSLVESTSDFVWEADAAGRYTYASPQVKTLLGFAPEEVLGKTPFDFMPPEEAAKVVATFQALAAAKAPLVNLENANRHRDGRLVTLETSGTPILNAAGELCGYRGIDRDVTERRQAEEALRLSEQKFRSFVQTTKEWIWSIDLEGNHTFSNPAVEVILGYPPEMIVGKNALNLIHPDDRAIVSKMFRDEAVLKKGWSGVVLRWRHKDGSHRFLESAAVPMLDSQSRCVGFQGADRDVTERRQAEDQLRVLAEMLDITPVAIMIHSFDGQIHYANRHAPELHGYTVEEFLRLNLRELDVPESAALIEQRMNLLREKGEASFEVGHYRKDRSVIPVMISTRHTVWRGQPVILSVGMDITERKRAELILQESEQKFRALFENMAEGVALHEIVCNAQGEPVDYRLLDVNPAYGRQTGLLPEQARGRRASELYGISEPPYLKEWTEVARTGKPRTFEAFFAPLGRHFHISAVSPKPGVFATVFEDITERKRNEEELRRKNEELERFTYTVSHDLKSPLITIKGFAGALLQDAEAGRFDRVQGDLKRIAGATDKMAELLNDLLELSRIGRIMNPPSEVNLEHLVREVVELLAGPVSQGQVEIAVHPGLPVVVGDRQRLREVFQNLIENAIRFMGGQPRPRVEVGQRLDGAERVFFVRDNGAGIEPRYQETVFGLFNKLDAKTPGTGIGLALVRRIVEVHGGRIWVESEGRKRGATFCFTLPLTTPKRKESQP